MLTKQLKEFLIAFTASSTGIFKGMILMHFVLGFRRIDDMIFGGL